MGEASIAPLWPPRTIRGLIWFAYVAAWSTALLVPVPPTPVEALHDPDIRFWFAKSLHVAAYATLAILTGWLRTSGTLRWLLLFFLFAHGVLTEFFQWYFPSLGRTGCVPDVIRDWVGVTLGLALTWKWWLRK